MKRSAAPGGVADPERVESRHRLVGAVLEGGAGLEGTDEGESAEQRRRTAAVATTVTRAIRRSRRRAIRYADQHIGARATTAMIVGRPTNPKLGPRSIACTASAPIAAATTRSRRSEKTTTPINTSSATVKAFAVTSPPMPMTARTPPTHSSGDRRDREAINGTARPSRAHHTASAARRPTGWAEDSAAADGGGAGNRPDADSRAATVPPTDPHQVRFGRAHACGASPAEAAVRSLSPISRSHCGGRCRAIGGRGTARGSGRRVVRPGRPRRSSRSRSRSSGSSRWSSSR